MTEGVLDEMNALRLQFPYNAAEMLADPARVEAYKGAAVFGLPD